MDGVAALVRYAKGKGTVVGEPCMGSGGVFKDGARQCRAR